MAHRARAATPPTWDQAESLLRRAPPRAVQLVLDAVATILDPDHPRDQELFRRATMRAAEIMRDAPNDFWRIVDMHAPAGEPTPDQQLAAMRIFAALDVELLVQARDHVLRLHGSGVSRERAIVIVVSNLDVYATSSQPTGTPFTGTPFTGSAHRLDE